jgi:hypothetical protein
MVKAGVVVMNGGEIKTVIITTGAPRAVLLDTMCRCAGGTTRVNPNSGQCWPPLNCGIPPLRSLAWPDPDCGLWKRLGDQLCPENEAPNDGGGPCPTNADSGRKVGQDVTNRKTDAENGGGEGRVTSRNGRNSCSVAA